MAPFVIFYLSWYYLDRQLLLFLWYIYVAIPIIDMILPLDDKSLSKEQTKMLENDKWFMIPLYLLFLCDFLTYFWTIYMLAEGSFESVFQKVIFLFSVIHLGTLGMSAGHELFHRKEFMHKLCGTLIYAKAMYAHFYIEHTKGHHKNVATPIDPVTARQGESIYQYLPRCIFGSLKNVWKIESARLARKPTPETPFSINNRMMWFVLKGAYLLFLAYYFNFEVMMLIIVYSAFSIVLIEAVSYIEHYGLRRKSDENGVYEPISIMHSWDAPQQYTNYLLFKLQKHSDHHANSYKPYQTLVCHKDAPTLPNGYTASLMTAFVPNVWFKVIDPL